jgi:hypothetical protein
MRSLFFAVALAASLLSATESMAQSQNAVSAAKLCAIVVDWQKERSRAIKIVGGLGDRGIRSGLLLFSTVDDADTFDVRSTADIVFSAKPALIAIHLSSFYSHVRGMDNQSFGDFFRLIETAGAQASPPYRPHYVIYSRAEIDDNSIKEWSGLPTELYAARTEIIGLTSIPSAERVAVILSSVPEISCE